MLLMISCYTLSWEELGVLNKCAGILELVPEVPKGPHEENIQHILLVHIW